MKDVQSPPSNAIIDEAAGWLVKISEKPLSPADQQQLNAWLSQSPQHEHAWRAAMRFSEMLNHVPPDLGRRVLARNRLERRAVLRGIAALAITAPVGLLTWNRWSALSADYRTATGEQRELMLPDGGQMLLNTATRVDIRFTQSQRLVRLIEGEILLTTAPDPLPVPRPFIVETDSGLVRALGTRFSVRHTDQGATLVSVLEAAVAIRSLLDDNETRVEAGQTVRFDRSRISAPAPHQQQMPAWVRGQILSDNQRLGDFIAELARYRPGMLRCDPAVADLRISGVFQLNNTDQVLEIVASTLPVRISRATDYWVSVTTK